AGKVAHHVMQKRIGPNIENDQPTVLEQLKMMNGLDRRFRLALARTECTEIVGTDEYPGRFAHTLDIKRAMIPGHLFCKVCRPDLVVVNDIAIATGHCAESRIEMHGHFLGPGHADISRQVHVRTHHPCVHRARNRSVEMHHLSAGMNQCIGASGAAQGDGVTASDLAKCFFQGKLDGGHAITLALKATIARAFVFDAKGDPRNASGSRCGCRFRYCFNHIQASLASISRASCCCVSLPSTITSSRISRAPSASPM